eukprot:6734232-Prymnesium_polylepis.1
MPTARALRSSVLVSSAALSSSQHLELHLIRPGSVSNLVVGQQSVQTLPLPHHRVELHVQAAGLNFRDVLNILDLDPTRKVRPIGLECASVAGTVGECVVHLARGIPAFGMAPGCLASRVRSDARLQAHLPRALSFDEACTLPILWCTTSLALAGHMTLCARQSMLIHAATGGLGLVSLFFTQHVGAINLCSAGRPSKVINLRTIRAGPVCTSRDAAAFAFGAITCLAAGRVHAALSALTKSFIPNSLILLEASGCYLEVGKNNIWSDARMSAAAAC